MKTCCVAQTDLLLLSLGENERRERWGEGSRELYSFAHFLIILLLNQPLWYFLFSIKAKCKPCPLIFPTAAHCWENNTDVTSNITHFLFHLYANSDLSPRPPQRSVSLKMQIACCRQLLWLSLSYIIIIISFNLTSAAKTAAKLLCSNNDFSNQITGLALQEACHWRLPAEKKDVQPRQRYPKQTVSHCFYPSVAAIVAQPHGLVSAPKKCLDTSRTTLTHSVPSGTPHSALTCTGMGRTQDALGASTITMQNPPRTVKVEILEGSGSPKPLKQQKMG